QESAFGALTEFRSRLADEFAQGLGSIGATYKATLDEQTRQIFQTTLDADRSVEEARILAIENALERELALREFNARKVRDAAIQAAGENAVAIKAATDAYEAEARAIATDRAIATETDLAERRRLIRLAELQKTLDAEL